MQLDPAAAASGVRLVSHDQLDSSNAEALRLARAGERGPLWITARQQSAGRGRRGRNWVSEPGNLHATLLLTDPSPAEHAAQLSFVAALALHDAIGLLAPAVPALALKWPNDLLLGERKFAGILIESEAAADGLVVAIGMGVNCDRHPADTPYPATDLAAAGARVTPDDLLRALSGSFLARLRQWDRGAGFAAVRQDWLARAAGIGHEIRVRLPEQELAGRFEALDAAGRLVLRLPDGGLQTITAGEVFAFPRPTTAAAAGTDA
jgi:BirA family biotin operon repressor/biotin-[acetyl-CoA-carboxylase] ligase